MANENGRYLLDFQEQETETDALCSIYASSFHLPRLFFERGRYYCIISAGAICSTGTITVQYSTVRTVLVESSILYCLDSSTECVMGIRGVVQIQRCPLRSTVTYWIFSTGVTATGVNVSSVLCALARYCPLSAHSKNIFVASRAADA